MILFLFQSTRQVVKADRLLKSNDVKHKIIPVPREISSECGMSIKVEDNLKEIVKDLLKNNGINYTDCEIN